MNYKKSTSLFLTVILFHIAAVFVFAFVPGMAERLTGIANLLAGQMIIIVPTVLLVLILVLKKKTSLLEVFAFRRIKPGSIFMLMLMALLLLPLTMVFNLISMLFTTNAVTAISSELLDYNQFLLLFIIGMVGPTSEEMVFRGAIFGGMRKNVSARSAVLMSALAFGLMHMNFNQAMYAIPLGIFMALAVEATGSLWGSVAVHMTINLQQTATMLIANKLVPGLYENPELTNMGNDKILIILSVYLVIALIATVCAGCCLVWVAKHQNRISELKAAVLGEGKGNGTKSRLFNWQMIVAVIVSLGYMTFLLTR